MSRIEEFSAACPEGKVAFIVTVRALAGFEPGDVVLAWRPDNGLRGLRRIREGVIVGRYVDADDHGNDA